MRTWLGRRGMGWSPIGIRVFAALLIALQVVQGVNDPVSIQNSTFSQSYYLITYQHGFVRRGLLGEFFHLIFGVPTVSEVDVSIGVATALAVVAVLVVIELLVRRGTAGSWSMAILLAASPFLIDFFIVDLRPDLLALALLVALGIALTRVTRALLPWLGAIGLAFGALVLVHEDIVLVQIPWAIVLVTVATLGRTGSLIGPNPLLRQLAGRLVALLVAPAAATVAVLVYGLPSAHKVAQLKADVSSFPLRGGSMFIYLPDSIRASMRLVASMPQSVRTHTLLLGGILVLIQLAWIVRWVEARLWSPFAREGNRGIGLLLAAIIVVSTATLFLTGIDWLRWFADCGAAALIAQAFAVLLLEPARGDPSPVGTDPEVDEPGTEPGPVRIHLSHWLPALAVYLAAIPPLDVLNTSGLLYHFLFFV